MVYKNIVFKFSEHIAHLIVNRPDKLNALNAETFNEMEDAVDKFESDPSLGAMIVTGAGDKAFAAGADIQELAEQSPVEMRATSLRGQRLFARMERVEKPIVAAVNGFALGGGLELALGCHMRTASLNAKLGLPEVGLGVIPGYGGTQKLTRLIGKARAMELVLSGDPITAEQALQMGLVNKVFPADKLLEETENWLRKIMAKGPLAVGFAIRAVNFASESTIEAGQELEAALFGLVASTEDLKEGMNAFLKKRKAEFKRK